MISNPIPCNTAFPADHVSIHSTTENGKDSGACDLGLHTQSISEEPGLPKEGISGDTDIPSKKDVNASDSDDLSSNDINTPKRQSLCDSENVDDGSTGSQDPEQAESDTSHSDDSGVEVPRPEVVSQEVGGASESADADVQQSPEQESTPDPAPQEAKAKPPPVPAPRLSFHSTERSSLPHAETSQVEEKGEVVSQDPKMDTSEKGPESQNPPGFLYKVKQYSE